MEYKAWEADIMATWNAFCVTHPAYKAIKLVSGSRRTHLKKRFEEPPFRDDFTDILCCLADQPFCSGQNDRNWVASFDWIICNDNNYIKVMELRYKKSALPGKELNSNLSKYIKHDEQRSKK